MNTFPPFIPMQNVIQNYAWGSTTAITELFDVPNPKGEPQAEIWMGAHPNGCSELLINGENIRLDEFVEHNKSAILGERTAQQFNALPFLFKILSADKALSIQVHPDKTSAEKGFAKENQLGIDITSSTRNYKDPNHKPELIYALTPYQAMNGFRDYKEIIRLFSEVNAEALTVHVEQFKAQQNEAGLSQFFSTILSLTGNDKASALEALIQYANTKANTEDGHELESLLIELARQYPGDIGLFAPLMLHCVTLKPGEAMFLDACTPHAYIKGTGLEIMANSDNVLRAGLTPKHIDIEELLANTICQPKPTEHICLRPEIIGNAQHYPIPVEDFKFSLYQGDATITCESAEMILAIDSEVVLTHEKGETLRLSKGQSAFVPYQTGKYQVSSAGSYARAYN